METYTAIEWTCATVFYEIKLHDAMLQPPENPKRFILYDAERSMKNLCHRKTCTAKIAIFSHRRVKSSVLILQTAAVERSLSQGSET